MHRKLQSGRNRALNRYSFSQVYIHLLSGRDYRQVRRRSVYFLSCTVQVHIHQLEVRLITRTAPFRRRSCIDQVQLTWKSFTEQAQLLSCVSHAQNMTIFIQGNVMQKTVTDPVGEGL
jgi:hypothetical protein